MGSRATRTGCPVTGAGQEHICPPARQAPALPAQDRMCWEERLVVAEPGGWSRAAGGFLNSSPAGLAASEGRKQAAGALPACHPMPQAWPGQGRRQRQ